MATTSVPLAMRLGRWVRSIALVRIFASDPWLAVATGVLLLVTWAPLATTTFIPLQDLPNHVGMTAGWLDALFGHGLTAKHYAANLRPVPYWTSYVSMIALGVVFSPVMVAKLTVAMTIAMVPLGAIRLCGALGRDPRQGLLAFVFCWDYSISWGFLSHVLGMALTLIALAAIHEADTPKKALWVMPWAGLVALTHVLATGVFGVAATLLLLGYRPFWKRFFLGALGMSGSLIALLPWLLGSLIKRPGDLAGAPPGWSFDWVSLHDKLAQLPSYVLFALPGPDSANVRALAFVMIVFVPVAMAALPQRRSQPGDWAVALSAAGAFAMYLAIPMNVYGPVWHTITFPRFAAVAMLFLSLVPKPTLKGAYALVLAPTLLAATMQSWEIGKAFRAFDKEAAPFRDIIAAVRKDTSVFPILNDTHSAASGQGSFDQFHAYIFAYKKGFDPYLFDYAANMLTYRSAARLPQVNWGHSHEFTMDKVGQYYDYVLIEGLSRDQLAGDKRAKLVKEAGRWRLYEVVK